MGDFEVRAGMQELWATEPSNISTSIPSYCKEPESYWYQGELHEPIRPRFCKALAMPSLQLTDWLFFPTVVSQPTVWDGQGHEECRAARATQCTDDQHGHWTEFKASSSSNQSAAPPSLLCSCRNWTTYFASRPEDRVLHLR